MKSRRRFPHQHGDGVLRLSASKPDVGGLRTGCLKLSLGLIHAGESRRAAFKQYPVQLPGSWLVRDCLIEQRLFGILSAQSEEVAGELRMRTEIECGQVSGAGLLAGSRRRH